MISEPFFGLQRKAICNGKDIVDMDAPYGLSVINSTAVGASLSRVSDNVTYTSQYWGIHPKSALEASSTSSRLSEDAQKLCDTVLEMVENNDAFIKYEVPDPAARFKRPARFTNQ